ncbi:BA75_01479T0 [Komagataella pastoris]|uniref:BA75_01479T0 n=1 Tax=Komagataella pastoris TaxID=4922 RepID=A0A1B2J7E5_PICPA|nr:BA75_01479T0 [Komagataella pastoris]
MHPILEFFSLQVLDDRLLPDSKRKQQVISKSHISRWNTWEFRIYLLVFFFIVPLMYKTCMDASNETNPNYNHFQHLLSQGWMFNRKVDNSDSQYRFFRDNLPMLVGLIVLHSGLRKLVGLGVTIQRTTFDFLFGIVFLFGAHGYNCLRIYFHVFVTYLLARLIPNPKYATLACWIWAVSTLFINDNYRTVQFGSLSPSLAFMDQFHGIIARWDVFYNFTVLRMLSFNLDYLNAKGELAAFKPKKDDNDSGTEIHNVLEKQNPSTTSILSDKERMNNSLPLNQYNLFNYISYVTYTPLYIAGPVITFNDYFYQSFNPLPTINFKKTAIYGLRLLFCILVMEFLLHFMYVVAVSKTKAWQGNTPFQISMIGLFNLNIVWLKLLIPWRMFRFWSLIDGIDPPENMIRCMDNNYSAMAFWRAWHRSFNRWTIKYIYVPLGGSRYRILTSLAVFSFVAIWHDIELKLLMWGWIVVLFLLPEITLTNMFKPYSERWWFRHVCAVGAIINIWMMMFANLYGFVLGGDGMKLLITEIFTSSDGLKFLVSSCVCLFVAAQVMFELREAEKRRGIDVRC